MASLLDNDMVISKFSWVGVMSRLRGEIRILKRLNEFGNAGFKKTFVVKQKIDKEKATAHQTYAHLSIHQNESSRPLGQEASNTVQSIS